MTKQEQSDWMFQLAITQGRTKRPSLATQIEMVLARWKRDSITAGEAADAMVKTQDEFNQVLKGGDGEELSEAVV